MTKLAAIPRAAAHLAVQEQNDCVGELCVSSTTLSTSLTITLSIVLYTILPTTHTITNTTSPVSFILRQGDEKYKDKYVQIQIPIKIGRDDSCERWNWLGGTD